MFKKVNIEFKVVILWSIMLLLAVLILKQFWFEGLLNSENFLNWDAEHYGFIAENGYQGFRVAFFPLFPLVWRLLSVSEIGVSMINAFLFLFTFIVLIKELRIRKIEEILLYLSIPSGIFFFLPYTESLFFVFSTLILLGLKNNKFSLVYIGLFLATLSRPAFTIFIPALFIVEFLNKDSNRKFSRIAMYLVSSLLGVLIVGAIQYMDTGEWFKFFQAQKGWGNELQIPKLPLTSFAGGFSIRTDAMALLVGLLAGGFLSAIILRLNWVKSYLPSKEVVFSLAYIGGITLSVLMFRGGSLFSLNRFVFATPFIIVVMNYWINQNVKISFKKLLVIFILIFSFWFLFNSYVHIKEILKYAFITFYALLLFAIKSDRETVRKASLMLLVVQNFTFLIVFFCRFLTGGWVG